jgi:hypothetical protein
MKNKLFVFLLLLTFTYVEQSVGQIIDNKLYVNSKSGNNIGNGTKESPLKTLSEAAKRVNQASGEGAITIYLAAGIYGMSETADFNPTNWKFTKENRLVIRAEVLPDDEAWSPSEMPVMVSTMPFSVEKNAKGEVTGGQNFGILIQTSHVTIQGLRILGEPVHENPAKGVLIRNYPIVWEGKNLEDFRVSQSLFIGNKFALPNHLGILSNGKSLEVDHCVFYGVKDAVVMWNNPASNSSMHHNLIIDSYGGIVWTWSATPDFKFYNNVISNANVLWILNKDAKDSFAIENSVIIGYNTYVNKGGGPQGFGESASPEKLKVGKNVILKQQGKLDIIDDQTSKLYLHLKPNTLGSNLGAGLFLNTK